MDTGSFLGGVMLMGCVIWNHDRNMVLANCKRLVPSANASVVEEIAIRWGLQLAHELKLDRILVH